MTLGEAAKFFGISSQHYNWLQHYSKVDHLEFPEHLIPVGWDYPKVGDINLYPVRDHSGQHYLKVDTYKYPDGLHKDFVFVKDIDYGVES